MASNVRAHCSPSLEIMVYFRGNHPQMAELFRLVNYYNLPRMLWLGDVRRITGDFCSWQTIELPEAMLCIRLYPATLGDKEKHISLKNEVAYAMQLRICYPLVNSRNYGKSPCFMGKSTINGDFP